HVPRRELLALLRGGQRRLTLLAAPPGFGKTTLLAEWAASTETAGVAWLSGDENGNEPARFLAYVPAALRRGQAELCGRAEASLQSGGADLVDVVLALLLNDLAGLDRELALVVDDYHLITNPEIHEAVAYLIERSPAAFHLVLATREDPPLPLGRL